jgi:short-subunit dehydrogenase
MDYRGKTALVTGASAGLGRAYAEALAARGADLILVARRKERLDALAEALGGGGRRVRVVAADLSQPTAPAEIFGETADMPPDILVNNAGFGLPGTYDRTSWPQQRDFLQLMVTGCCHLAHLCLPGMIERGFGRIVNVASLAGIVPSAAGHTLYGASKAFLISFSQSLAAEGKARGVRAQACCPGFTYTEFHDVNGTRARMGGIPKAMWMQAGDVVDGSLAALEKGPVVYIPGMQNKALATLARVLPLEAAAAVMSRQAMRYRSTEGPGSSSPAPSSSSGGKTTVR